MQRILTIVVTTALASATTVPAGAQVSSQTISPSPYAGSQILATPPVGVYDAPSRVRGYGGPTYGYVAPAPVYGAPSAGTYGADTAYTASVKCGASGALGGDAGVLAERPSDKHQCDQRGAYWSYSNTLPYQAAPAADPRAGEYANRGCRLAAASVDGQQARYVRVCPDAQGRYRVAG